MKEGKSPIDKTSLQTYFDQIRNIPLLTFEEELELSRRIQNGDESARRRLIEANLRLVIRIARRYLSFDIALMDLIQEGNIGLIHAVEKYDHERQVHFSTYAALWIRQSIARYLFDKRRTIRIPHRKEELLRKIKSSGQSLTQVYMREPSAGEIAKETGIPEKEVEHLLSLAHSFIIPGNEKQDTEYMNIIDFHEDHTYSPEREIMKKSSREATLKVLDRLKDREKRVLVYRYQLNGEKRHTLKNISDKMGLSMETVRQIELKALRKLRFHAEELRTYLEVI